MASTGLPDSPSTGATATATATTNASAGPSLTPGLASSSAATGTRGLSTGGEGLPTEPEPDVPESDKPVLVIVGATGVGKSKLSVDLALRLNGEVVNADAVQMYRGLDIAAAKVSQEEMQGVPHHLMSFLDHTDSYTVKRFRNNALTVINDIHSRGKLPIIVGGTLYYIQNVLWPTLIDGSETDAEPDEPIDDRAGVEIPEGMTPHEYLSKIDPVRADTLHPRDTRKIQRSIYVTKTRGRPHSEIIAELQASGVQNKLRFRTAVLWLRCNKNVHEERLDKRVDGMLEAGIVEEAMSFIKEHDLIDKLKANDPCLQDGQFQAIGFKEFLPFLRASEDPNVDARTRAEIKKECLNTLLTHHNQYRKYQTKWIRKRLLTRNAPVYGLETDRCGKHPFAWDRDVVEPSVEVYKWLTSTTDLSNTEPKGMRRENASAEDQTLSTYHCALCNVTSIGKTQHMKHIKGQRHRRREQACQVPRQNKRPRDERFAELLKEELEREAAKTKKDDGVTGPKADSS